MPSDLQYREDILKIGFEQCTIPLSNDYEGKVIATLIRQWSKTESSKAILYIHGFNDYFFQQEMAFRFIDNGYNFYALDLRKYGRSFQPHQKFNDIRNLKDYYEEINKAIDIIKNEQNTNITLMGHSTGGLILTLYAKDHTIDKRFDGLILNSPFYKFNLNPVIRSLIPVVSFFGKYFPRLRISGGFAEEYGKNLHKSFDGEWEYNLDWKPNIPPKVNLGWIRAIHRAQRELSQKFSISQPVLVMHSSRSTKDTKDLLQLRTSDSILNVADIDKISQNISGNVEISTISGGLHDLVLSQELVRIRVYNTIFDWLKRHNL